MPQRNSSRRYVLRLVLFTLAGWLLWAVGRESAQAGKAETATAAVPDASEPKRARTKSGGFTKRRLATTLAFTTLFFAGAATDVLLVVTPDAQVLRHAETLVRVLASRCGRDELLVAANACAAADDAAAIARSLSGLAARPPHVRLRSLGSIPADDAVAQAALEALGSTRAISPRSWPAENARPAPVRTTHAMSSRALASWNVPAHAS